MKNFFDELYKLTPDELPGIEPNKLSEKQIGRIASKTHKKISGKCSIRSRPHLLRRAVTVAAAAALITVMATTTFAYRDAITDGIAQTGRLIMDLFSREEEMIDPKSEIIALSDEESGIRLEVEKAVRDGDDTYLYLTIKNLNENFDSTLITCESYTLYQSASPLSSEPQITPKKGWGVIENRLLGINGVYAGDILANLRNQPSTDTIKMILPVSINGAGIYRFTIDKLMHVSEEMDSEGYTGNLLREVIAEELTVDFTIEGELEPLERTVIECENDFTVSGVTLTLDQITVSPLEIVVDIRDMHGEKITVSDWETEALDCLHHYYHLYNLIKADENMSQEDSNALFAEIRPTDFYDVKIEFTDENLKIDEFRSTSVYGYAFGPDQNLHREVFRTVTPVYPEEIARIYLVNFNDPDDRIIIWEK